MTDRISGFVVVLKEDMRVDDAENLRSAFFQFSGVIDVIPHLPDFEEKLAESRIREELKTKLWDVLIKRERER